MSSWNSRFEDLSQNLQFQTLKKVNVQSKYSSWSDEDYVMVSK